MQQGDKEVERVLKAGVIGVGILGRWHSKFLHDHPNTRLVAVADTIEERAKAEGEKYGAHAYKDYVQMLQQEKLDLVVVATPDPFHRDPVVAAAQAGVPYIVTEKPMATTVADAKAMLEATKKAGAKLWVNLNNRVGPMDRATRYVIQNGLIGKPVYGEVRVDDNIIVPTQMWGNRSKEWASGSSTAQFLFSHVTDLMRWYFQPAEVTKVYAVSKREVLGYTPDLFDGFLFFDSGLLLRIKSEWIKHIEGLVEFYECFSGDQGIIIYNKIPGFGVQHSWRANLSREVTEQELMKHHRALGERGISARAVMYNEDPYVATLPVEGGPQRRAALEMYPSSRPHPDLMKYILDAILEGKDIPSSWEGNGPLPTGEDGLVQTKMVCAIERSAELGREVTIAEME